MSKLQPVAWVDGILVTPQHFEQQERAFDYQIQQGFQRLSPHLWGMNEYQIDENFLAQNKLRFSKCSGWFQDGTYFQLDALALANMIIDIDEDTTDELIYIALPSNHHISESHVRQRRYSLQDNQVADSCQPDSDKTTVVTRKLQLQLLRESQNRSTYFAIPIVKIKQVDSEKGIQLDENFIPPTINLHNNQTLVNDLNLFTALLERKQTQLAKLLHTPLQGRYLTSLTDIALLQLLNRYVVIFHQYQEHSHWHPFEFYQSLVQLLGELGTFYHDKRLAIHSPNYRHQQMNDCFAPIKQQLLRILQTQFEHQAIEVSLKKLDTHYYQAQIDEQHSLTNNEWVIGIRGQKKMNNEVMMTYLKVASQADLNDIVNLQLSGLELQALSIVPPQLPYYDDMHYFQIIKNVNYWENVNQQQILCLYVDAAIKQRQINCWAIPQIKQISSDGE